MRTDASFSSIAFFAVEPGSIVERRAETYCLRAPPTIVFARCGPIPDQKEWRTPTTKPRGSAPGPAAETELPEALSGIDEVALLRT